MTRALLVFSVAVLGCGPTVAKPFPNLPPPEYEPGRQLDLTPKASPSGAPSAPPAPPKAGS